MRRLIKQLDRMLDYPLNAENAALVIAVVAFITASLVLLATELAKL